MKKILCIILGIIMIVSACPLLSFAENSGITARLYTVYGDGMLFQQKEKSRIAGSASDGAVISFELLNENSISVTSGSDVAENGEFEISFTAPAGSYDEYTINVYENGKKFDSLENVVFGELWLSNGQSNMQLPLCATDDYETVQNEKRNPYIRIMIVDELVDVLKGAVAGYDLLDEPQSESIDCHWITAVDDIAYVSGVGYYFASKLQKELDVPVGFLNVSVGGSLICTWLSREGIENNPNALKALKNHNAYIESDEWNKKDKNNLGGMTVNYNMIVYGLRFFKIAGMIWYQGESEQMAGYSYGEYSALFDVLQDDYTKLFGYENGKLPIIFSQYVYYTYNKNKPLQDFNTELTEMQKSEPESRALVTLYDIPTKYSEIYGAVHPTIKRPIGERMTDCAMGLVYGKTDTYTAASVKEYSVFGNVMTVTFNNTGDGLKVKGDKLYDFALAGKDGVFYKAEAKIISKNKIEITSEYVSEPVSASYAYTDNNCRANLYATVDGELKMPVSPFVIGKNENNIYMPDYQWADCEASTVWHSLYMSVTGYFNAWNSFDCVSAVSENSAYEGKAGLNVTSESETFSVKQDFYIKVDGKEYQINEYNNNFSNYGAISFKVKNNGTNDVTFAGMKIKMNMFSYYPEVNGAENYECVIPADGEWYTVEVDLNSLYLNGGCIKINKNILFGIKSLELFFKSDESSNIDIDNFEIKPETEEENAVEKVNYGFSENIKKLAERFVTVIKNIFGCNNTVSYNSESFSKENLTFVL